MPQAKDRYCVSQQERGAIWESCLPIRTYISLELPYFLKNIHLHIIFSMSYWRLLLVENIF